MKKLIPGILLASAFALTPLPGHAQPSPVPADTKTGVVRTTDDWSFRVAAYSWLVNLSGNATAHGQTVDFNASIVDLFQKSSSLAAWNSYVEANKGAFGFYADLVWAKLSIPNSASNYRNPVAGVQLSSTTSSTTSTSLTIVEMGGAYEAVKWTGGDGSATAIDVLAGLRYWNVSSSLTLDITGTVDFSRVRFDRFDRGGSVGIVDSGTLQWVDPLIGLRLRHQFAPNQELTVRGDIGGFGIPGGSLFSWQAAAVYSYAWQFDGYSLAALGGYRALSTKFNINPGIDGSSIDLLIHGPMIGLGVRF